jgi:GNAT superfamily N-acetyltransferase
MTYGESPCNGHFCDAGFAISKSGKLRGRFFTRVIAFSTMSLDREKATGAYRIISGDEPQKHIGPLTALRFSKMLAESMHDTAPVRFPEFRERMRAVLNGPARILVDHEFQLDWLYPYPSTLEAIGIIHRDIRTMLRDKALVAALLDEKPVGIGGFKEVSDPEESKPIFELARIAIDPGHRRKGIFPALTDTIMQEALTRKPNVLLINATRKSSMIRWSLENGFSEINWSRFYEDYKKLSFDRSQRAAFADRVQRFQWRYFERDAASLVTDTTK